MAKYSILCSTSLLVGFGGGHDFSLSNNCNSVNTSYSNFGYSYDTNGKPTEFLTGSYNFTVKEIEVYKVDYTGELLVKNERENEKNK